MVEMSRHLASTRPGKPWNGIEFSQLSKPGSQLGQLMSFMSVTFLDPNVKLQTLVHWLRRWWWGRNPKAGHENSSILSSQRSLLFRRSFSPGFICGSVCLSHTMFDAGTSWLFRQRMPTVSSSQAGTDFSFCLGRITCNQNGTSDRSGNQKYLTTWSTKNITEHQLTRVFDSLYEKMFLWSLDVTCLIKFCHLKCTLAKTASFSIAPFPVPSSLVISSAMDQTEKHTWFTSHWYTATRDTNNK